MEFGDETTKIIINTKGKIGDVSQDFKDFVRAVNGEFDTTGYSAKIKSEIEKIKSNYKWRREYMTLYLHEQQMMRKSLEEGRQKGLEEGLKEGREKGLEEGRKEGRLEGRLEGRKEGRLEGREEGIKEGKMEATELAIRNMLKKLSPEEIIEMGYDKELVMRLDKKE